MHQEPVLCPSHQEDETPKNTEMGQVEMRCLFLCFVQETGSVYSHPALDTVPAGAALLPLPPEQSRSSAGLLCPCGKLCG